MKRHRKKSSNGLYYGLLAGLFVLCLLIHFIEPVTDGDTGEALGLGGALWFTMVTITTVGYGDWSPTSFGGQFIAVMMFAYSVVVFSFIITKIQNDVAEKARLRELGMDGTKFSQHVVLCSFTGIGRVALLELLAAGRKVAVITEDPNIIPIIRELGNRDNLFVTVGDSTTEEALNRANVQYAHTVIAASDDDAMNLIIALSIRRLQPNARIVVSTTRAELRNTLQNSGVTYVASPFELSGRLIASAAFEPEVARFIEDVTSGADDIDNDPDDLGYDLQQFQLTAASPVVNYSVGQASQAFRQMKGPLIVAVSKHIGNGQFKLYPHPDDNMVLAAHDSLVVLGHPEQNSSAANYLGVQQGG